MPEPNISTYQVKMLGCGKFLSVAGVRWWCFVAGVRSRYPRSGVWLLDLQGRLAVATGAL